MSLQEIIYRFRYALSIVEPGALAIGRFRCPLCESTLLLRLARTDIGVRCLNCAASAITLAMVSTLLAERPEFRRERVYELSSRGPLARFLLREVPDLTLSEYFDDLAPGAFRDGVQCQDIQNLTYPDASFDLVTSTEVFEHVADDRRGFAEIRRVLRPGGAFIFTVPIENADRTVERAVIGDGVVKHLLPPAYHDDRIRGKAAVLVFRDYGRDIAARLLESGFRTARIESKYERAFLGAGRGVVIARA